MFTGLFVENPFLELIGTKQTQKANTQVLLIGGGTSGGPDCCIPNMV